MYFRYADVSFIEASRDPEKMVKAHLAFREKFDVDFLKMMPDGMYMAEAWGTKLKWENGNAWNLESGVKRTEDWARVQALDPARDPILVAQLKAVGLLADKIGGEIPFIQTIFSPLTWAIKIAGVKQVMQDMRQNSSALASGLERIAESVASFGRECLNKGATGFFFAMQNTSKNNLTATEFDEFSFRYDMKILKELGASEFIMLHMCTRKGDEFYIDKIGKYPVHAINWWDKGSPLTLRKAREILGEKFCLIGGLDHVETLPKGTPEQVQEEVRMAVESVGKGGRFILGPGCTLPATTPAENLLAAIRAASTYSH
jgi:uroporphyrinogen decarboxylase